MRRFLVAHPAALALALVAAVFAVDLCLPLGVAAAVPYTFAVLLALTAKPGWVGPAVAALCMVLTVAKMEIMPERGHHRDVEGGREPLPGAVRDRHDDASSACSGGGPRRRSGSTRRTSRGWAELAVAGELATVLAHELNQPLAAVCLQADVAAHLGA